MKSSVRYLVIASFVTLCAFEANCHNYGKVLQKRETDEKANDPTMKEMFTKKDKRQAEYDEEEQHAFDDGKKEDTKSKREAPEMFEENFKDGAQESMNKMKEMFVPKSKRQADMKDNKEGGKKNTGKMSRRKRDVTESSTTEAPRAKRLVQPDLKEMS